MTRATARFANNGLARDVWSTDTEATATCFCGAVQMVVPITAPGLVGTFVCNCVDCRKVTASMFATNFTALDSHTRFVRGQDNLTLWGQAETTSTGGTMTNGFCKTCGTLMYRQGSSFSGMKFLRVGTVDDIDLHGTLLKPDTEMFTVDRVAWLCPLSGVTSAAGFPYSADAKDD